MRSRFQTLRATSIPDAIIKTMRFLERWSVYEPTYCWFRGIKNRDLPLQPGACWRKNFREMDALSDFVHRGAAFARVGRLDDWNTYYLAQHHGVPTRLLDWTESFMAALFFAFDDWNGRTTPCVWILQPYFLNFAVMNWDGLFGPEHYDECAIYLPRQIARERPMTVQDSDGYVYDNRWPLAIYPTWGNTRIHAQQGMFTIHGRNKAPLNEIIAELDQDAGDLIARIDLVGFERATIFSELGLLGVRRSAVYPDIDNFVREIKSLYRW